MQLEAFKSHASLGTTEGSDLFGRQEKKSLKSFLEETGADAIVIGSIDLLE